MLFVGIDVSKAKLDCSLLLDASSAKRRAKTVTNSKVGVSELLMWCAKYQAEPNELHAILEGTGVYHEPAALALADAGVTVSIVNPAQVKDFGRSLGVRTKTDGVDSWVLARYGALLNPRPWTPPAQEARVLQALLSRREAIAQDLQRERNRLEKAEATETPLLIRQSLLDSIAFLQQQLAKLQHDIDDHINKHPALKADRELLLSIPAVGPQVSNHLLAVMHNHRFQSAEQLAAYLGLVPVERQSGSSILGRPRLSKAGPARVRAVLYMAAIVGTQYNPHIKALYQRLQERGKTKMSALGAAMRKLVHLCFGVLKTRQPYQPNYGI
ncbi:IS110 family transposase [Candidatus Methylobacter oryzae]|uniref:IS110 family transposase n=1 Tax=Candidatus Methylobacter oryzae TaxID=2497749 RepID=A0ABY3C911_9GAMM|nr:IS110 family transposase [Candidatus Methylobacter oryzae]TRW93196.1 IS110 family transposase [Candidatus Methylobacter oryzae]